MSKVRTRHPRGTAPPTHTISHSRTRTRTRTFPQEIDRGQHGDVKLGILKIVKKAGEIEVRSECVETLNHVQVLWGCPSSLLGQVNGIQQNGAQEKWDDGGI